MNNDRSRRAAGAEPPELSRLEPGRRRNQDAGAGPGVASAEKPETLKLAEPKRTRRGVSHHRGGGGRRRRIEKKKKRRPQEERSQSASDGGGDGDGESSQQSVMVLRRRRF
jgi:hypothetical protein